jgi:hypothetical protein
MTTKVVTKAQIIFTSASSNADTDIMSMTAKPEIHDCAQRVYDVRCLRERPKKVRCEYGASFHASGSIVPAYAM